jgi:hypothetical protein
MCLSMKYLVAARDTFSKNVAAIDLRRGNMGMSMEYLVAP